MLNCVAVRLDSLASSPNADGELPPVDFEEVNSNDFSGFNSLLQITPVNAQEVQEYRRAGHQAQRTDHRQREDNYMDHHLGSFRIGNPEFPVPVSPSMVLLELV
jgi:hypothetical protein